MNFLNYVTFLFLHCLLILNMNSYPRFNDYRNNSKKSRYSPYKGKANRFGVQRFSTLCKCKGQNLSRRLEKLKEIYDLSKIDRSILKSEYCQGCKSLKEIVNKEDSFGKTPLSWAVFNHEYENTKKLLQYGADPNAGAKPALISASFNGALDIVDLLLKNGANPNIVDKNGKASLSWAAGNGHVDVVKKLIGYGADLNKADDEHQVPLHWAASHNNSEVLKILIENGAIIDFKDMQGGTALSWASFHGHENIVDLLLKNGANPNVLSNDLKLSPLHWAIDKNFYKIAELLINNNADPNLKNKNGETALSIALFRGNLSIAKLLVKNGADIVLAKDNHGMNSLMFAIQSGNREVVEFVIEQLNKRSINDPFSGISKKNNRSVLSWLVRMHPNAIEKKLNLFSRSDFDYLFKIFIEGYLKFFDLLQVDCYGGHVVYWLSVLGDYKNLNLLFDELRKYQNGQAIIYDLLNLYDLHDMTPLEKILNLIYIIELENDVFSNFNASEIYFDLYLTKWIIEANLYGHIDPIKIAADEIKDLLSKMNSYVKRNAISFCINDRNLNFLSDRLSLLNEAKIRIENFCRHFDSYEK